MLFSTTVALAIIVAKENLFKEGPFEFKDNTV